MQLQFDRGTIVISDPPAGIDVRELPGVLWDPRTSQCRAPGYRYADLIEHLRRLSIPIVDRVTDPPERTGGTRCVELRPYQDSALAAWQIAGGRGVVALPTGSGKTRLALGAIASTGVASIILVPTRVLLAQWCTQIASTLGVEAGCYGDGQRRIGRVTVATFESAYRHMARIGNRFGLLIVDEVHHFGYGTREDALVMCTAPMRMGLTGTPPKESPATQRLLQLIGPIVYQLSIADLTGSYLAEFELTTLTLPLNEIERAAYEIDMARFRPVCRQFFRLNPMASWPDFMRSADAPSKAGRR